MGTMDALIWKGDNALSLGRRLIPVLRDPCDAIVRVIRSTICISDLHICSGAVSRAQPDVMLGYELVGVAETVGNGVSNLRPGGRVAACYESFCGDCWLCHRGYVNDCIRGGWELGCHVDGYQAEYVRVSFADAGLTSIPDALSNEDALSVGDTLANGYRDAELRAFQPGDTVVALGLGPMGLCAAECIALLSAAHVIGVEPNPWRWRTVLEQGPVALTPNPVDPELESAMAAATEDRGANTVIECTGRRDTFQVAWRLARPNGTVALAAMYEGDQTLPLPVMYRGNLVFKTGDVDVSRGPELVSLLAQGKLWIDFLIIHQGPLSEVLENYRVFKSHEGHCLKWVVTPG